MLRRARWAIAVGAVLALVVSGCGGTKDDTQGQTAESNAGVGKVFNPSDTKGGTLKIAHSGDFDSLDPADTYYGYSWDFIRMYGRSLVMFATQPGQAGTKLVPDLAETLGVPSDNATTWTYKLRPGLKYEDGTPITSKDVKYGVERSLDKATFPNGPTYFNDLLDLQGYTSPYDDPSPDKLGLKAIETPDDRTVVFKLKQPFSGFDYITMMPPTMPVPRPKDTGSKYKEHVVSSGPYKFETNELGKRFTLVRNDQWSASSDPNRKALPDRIEVALNVNADDIDNRLISGDLHVSMEGLGVGTAAQGRILADENLKKNTDSAALARLWYISVNPNVAPLNDVHCRRAVLYAADHEGFQRAFGGSTGGDIATTLMPPQIPGAPKTDPYEFNAKKNGDVDKAKKELADCGQPGGFETNIAYRTERPKEKATAESMQQALAKVGIKLTIKPYAQGDYFKLYAGKPDFAKSNRLGLMLNGWGADWNDGFGFLQQIVDSRVIRPTGGASNLSVAIPDVDAMLDKALVTIDTPAREAIWGQIDKRVMEEAVVLPGVWAKVLLYRPPSLTNVFVNEGLGGYYDYTALGVAK
jgi:peptide/nickel transport system substrate-binding protein